MSWFCLHSFYQKKTKCFKIINYHWCVSSISQNMKIIIIIIRKLLAGRLFKPNNHHVLKGYYTFFFDALHRFITPNSYFQLFFVRDITDSLKRLADFSFKMLFLRSIKYVLTDMHFRII